MKTFQFSVVKLVKDTEKWKDEKLFWLNSLHLLKNAKSIFG